MKILAKIKKSVLSNFSAKSKNYDYTNKLVVEKVKDKTAGVVIK